MKTEDRPSADSVANNINAASTEDSEKNEKRDFEEKSTEDEKLKSSMKP